MYRRDSGEGRAQEGDRAERLTGLRDSGRGVSWNTEHGGPNKMDGDETTAKRMDIRPNVPEKPRN